MKKLILIFALVTPGLLHAQGGPLGSNVCSGLNLCAIPAANIVGSLPAADINESSPTFGATILNSSLSLSTMTSGSIPYFDANKMLVQDNAQFKYDAVNRYPILCGGAAGNNGICALVNGHLYDQSTNPQPSYTMNSNTNYGHVCRVNSNGIFGLCSGSAINGNGTINAQWDGTTFQAFGSSFTATAVNLNASVTNFTAAGSTFTYASGKVSVAVDTITVSGFAHFDIVISSMAGTVAGGQTIANCPAGYRAMSGGCQCTGGTALTTTFNLPIDGAVATLAGGVATLGVGWYCRAQGTVGATCDSFAVCGKFGP